MNRTQVGLRIRVDVRRPPNSAIVRARELAVPNIADAMHKFGTMSSRIQPCWTPSPTIAGPAITVKALPGDTLMLRKAMEVAMPGDVLVFDGQGSTHAAVWGGNSSIDMLKKGVEGLVVDGAVRDREELQEVGFPVFAVGTIPRTGTQAGPGEVNFPIVCGGVVVMPGDLIVGDGEGVVVLPFDDIDDILAVAETIQGEKGSPEDLQDRLRRAAPGTVHGLPQVDEKLAALGCQFVDEA